MGGDYGVCRARGWGQQGAEAQSTGRAESRDLDPRGRRSPKAVWNPMGQAVVLGTHRPLNPQGGILKTGLPPSYAGGGWVGPGK